MQVFILFGSTTNLFPEKKLEKFLKAKKHCERVIFDAIEIPRIRFLEKFMEFQNDFKDTVTAYLMPNHFLYYRKIDDCRSFTAKYSNRAGINEDSKNYDDYCKKM